VRTIEAAGEQGSPQWVVARRQWLGASDVGAMLGVSPYQTKLGLWASKTGRYEQAETLAMRLGRRMEPVIIGLYEEAVGVVVERHPLTYQHDDCPYLAASLDGTARVDGAVRVVEVKHLSHRAGRELAAWRDNPTPGERGVMACYWWQVQAQLAVTGLRRGDLVILADKQLEVEPIERNEDAVAHIEAEAWKFWTEHVLPDRPPHVDDRDVHVLADMHPAGGGGAIIVAPDDTLTLDVEAVLDCNAQLAHLHREIARIEKTRAGHQARVMDRMKDADALETDGALVTWKTSKRRARVVPASVVRTFRARRKRADATTEEDNG